MKSSTGAAAEVALERESVGAGAAGGAALGAVIALAFANTAFVPLLGAAIGAVGGGGLGHLANLLLHRRGRPAYAQKSMKR